MTFAQQHPGIDHAKRARTGAFVARAASVGLAVVHSLGALFRAWQAARARAELHALSDRMLNDIGLSRGEIESLFR